MSQTLYAHSFNGFHPYISTISFGKPDTVSGVGYVGSAGGLFLAYLSLQFSEKERK